MDSRRTGRSFWGIVRAIYLILMVTSTFAQDLPDAASKAGFSTVIGKTMGKFEVTALSGNTISSNDTATSPVLFHIWSIAKDSTADGPLLASTLIKAVPGSNVIVLSQDAAGKIQSTVKNSGLDGTLAAGGAANAIRALGGPSAPAWIFVAPGGQIVAYRLGRLDPASAVDAVQSLFGAYAKKPATPLATSVQVENPAPALSASTPKSSVPLNKGVTDSTFALPIELEIVVELNLARTQPAAYIEILKEYRGFIKGNYLERPGEITVVLNEGVKAVDQAIAFLQKQKPIPPLALSKGLSLAARDHARDQGKTGQTGHTGSDKSTMGQRIERYGQWQSTAGENIAYGGETARDMVIQLIVDDGVPSRGHRANIFNASFMVVGVAFGTHPGYRTLCVQDFAGGYTER